MNYILWKCSKCGTLRPCCCIIEESLNPKLCIGAVGANQMNKALWEKLHQEKMMKSELSSVLNRPYFGILFDEQPTR